MLVADGGVPEETVSLKYDLMVAVHYKYRLNGGQCRQTDGEKARATASCY